MSGENYAVVTLTSGTRVEITSASVSTLLGSRGMARLHQPDGGEILVNPEHVVTIEERTPQDKQFSVRR